ncbi:MAG: DUF559 domain-containing protein [Propionibacteriaceae bacterium]|nr:DUF559 domain-containing protein [Propionibacteriaceae bacterium]
MHPRLRETLDQGHGVLDRRAHPDLHHQLDNAIRCGDLVRVVPHVYAESGEASSLITRARAACLADPDAVIIGRAAAILGGWADLPEPDVVEVAAPRRNRPQPGFRFRQRRVPRSLSRRGEPGVRVTTFPMTALDLALQFGPDQLDDALRRGVDPAKLRAALEATRGRRGYELLRRQVHAVRDTPWSRLECAAHDLLRGAGVNGWVANRALYERQDVRIGYGDLVFADLMLVIELDGKEFHSEDGHARRDRARDRRLHRKGWEVIRVESDLVFHHPEEFVALVSDVVSTREAWRSRPPSRYGSSPR